MKLEQSFDVKAPIDVVWAALTDLERVAPCLPGAAITERDEDGTYHGTFQVKLGPTTASYRGTIRIDDTDEASHAATLKARGSDKRGQGGASATIVNTLTEAGDATHVDAVTDFTITGRLARFGRGGMIEDISNRLLRDFADCLQAQLSTPEAQGAEAAAAAATARAEPGSGTAGPEGSTASSADADAPLAEAALASAGAAGTAAEAEAETATPGSERVPPPAGAAAPRTTPPAPAPSRPAAKPISGFSLMASVFWERLARLFGRGKRR